jgi:uncharacterized membrane protein YhaH (DUF805 family)
LFVVLGNIFFAILEGIVRGAAHSNDPTIVKIISGLFNLGVAAPFIAAAVRRFHDMDRSGWWYLLSFVPVVGWILVLLWLAQKGTHDYNRWGSPTEPFPIQTNPKAQTDTKQYSRMIRRRG